MTNKKIPFQVKMSNEVYDKMKEESVKLWLTMSGFVAFIITKYKESSILFESATKDEIKEFWKDYPIKNWTLNN